MKDDLRETFYFKHDYDARGDDKMLALLMEHGWAAYGLYWALVEKLYQASGRLATDYARHAYDLKTDSGLLKAIVENFDLFFLTDDGKRFGSHSADRRLQQRRQKSTQARKAALVKHASAVRPHSVRIATAVPGEERRGEKRKVVGQPAAPPARTFTPPSLDAVKAYCLERRNGVDPQRWHDFYSAKGWAIGKNRMKDWQAAVRTWEAESTGIPGAPPKQPQCRCGVNGARPTVTSRDGKTGVCVMCREREDIEAGEK